MKNGKTTEKRRGKILSLLMKHPEGLTIRVVSDEVGAHKNTITKDLEYLSGSGDVKKRELGVDVLFYHKTHAKHLT